MITYGRVQRLCDDIRRGQVSPNLHVTDPVTGFSGPALEFPRLRPAFIDRVLDVGEVIRVDVDRGLLELRWDGWRAPAYLDEVVARVRRKESNKSWRTGLLIGLGVVATGIGIYALHRRATNNQTVDPRDPDVRAAICERDDFRCGICGARLSCGEMHLDHKHPKSRGGRDTWGNLQSSHAVCNQIKGASTMTELWRRLEN